MHVAQASLSRVAAAPVCQMDSPFRLNLIVASFNSMAGVHDRHFPFPSSFLSKLVSAWTQAQLESMAYKWFRPILIFSLSIAFLVSQSSCFRTPRLIESSAHENSVLEAYPKEVAMADVPPFQGVHLHHIARETSDVNRVVEFYQQVFGFQKLETPQSFGDFNVTWLHLPPTFALHVVERDPKSRLPESPFVVPSDVNADVSALWRGPHVSFRVSDYDAAIDTLKRKGIKYFEKTQQEGRVKQCFFFDPDGNGLEIGNWPLPK